MRIASSALAVSLAVISVPSVAAAQVLTPFSPGDVRYQNQSLSHVVPVATVNLLGDAVALADPHVVRAPSGEPFVLGAASLDLRDLSQPTIRFAITNSSRQAIPWNAVHFSVERAAPVPLEDQMKGAPDLFFCRLSKNGLAAAPRDVWQPGATVTVQVPIPTDCLRRAEAADPLGFLVYVGGELPHPDLSLGPSDPGWQAVSARRTALLRRALEQLTDRTPQQ